MNHETLFAPLLLAMALSASPAVPGEAAEPGSQASLSSVIIYTTDVERLADFYRQALLLGEPATVSEYHIGFWLGANYLGFEPLEGAAGRGAGATAWYGVGAIDAAVRRCVAAGGTARMPPTRQSWGDIHATVLDPDGNLMGLIESGGKEASPHDSP